ncbi:MAG TPA: MBL fold metallo-hydrolase, partial [Candidatus Sulfotelmatobacter sp.]|nr:MBL fold metallo-hydrolase [Candidatus Sulfotelmatobacter sp.]
VSDRVLAIRDGFVNCYVLRAGSGLVLMDAGRCPSSSARGFEELGLHPRDVTAVFLTHLHWDHAGGARLYPNAQVFVGEAETSSRFCAKALPPLHQVRDEETVEASGLSVRVVDTPGHTSGAVSYIVDGRLLFVGDTLRLRRGEALPMLFWFNRDGQALARSLQKLARLQGLECLLTGHSGVTTDLDRAFRRWRQPVANAPPQEGNPP